MAKDFLENLFDSVDLIVTNKIGNLNYDKTEQCTIIKVRGNNEYYVSNGSAKYIAFSQNDIKYREGDSVYITIPQGNYNNQKLIIGKHTSKESESIDWVSPMENFVNITENINPNYEKVGLIANDENIQFIEIWRDTSGKIYTQYDRLCLTGDFSTLFNEDLVIDGSYGLILEGTIKDTKLDFEILELEKQKEEINNNKIYTQEIKNQKINNINKEIIKIKEKYNISKQEQKFACVFDSKEMLGNPYCFDVPFKQEKLFFIEPTSEISNLRIIFYQGLTADQKWNATFTNVNNELIAVKENANIFVENVTINFGYSYETYGKETAILYTLDSKNYEKNDSSIVTRELKLRWVHYDEEQKPHSITNLNDNSLKHNYVKIHWYRYKIDDKKIEPDPLAGYFWEEIKDNEGKFSYKAGLNADWREEKFKVIIQFNEKLIKSEELIFSNPNGLAQYGKLITGLKINYPENDPYKGIFYIYGDDYNAGFNTEKTFVLIADYQSIDTSNNRIWDDSDVICWKFPADYTMIHMPEEGFEFDTQKNINTENRKNLDTFILAGSNESKEVNGVIFKSDPNYHQIIRRVEVERTYDQNGNLLTENSYNTRIQKYRIKGMFDSSSNNTIKCEVYKPEVNMVNAEVTFIFGLHTTNGTKYTLAVDWIETANSGTYQRPPAITVGDTQKWDFKVKILDSSQREIKPPEGGWNINLSWYENSTNGGNIDNLFDLSNPTLIIKNTFNIDYALYQVLQIQVTNFSDYKLTTWIPIPVRSDRNIIGIDGPDRIYYDSSGYNPKYNDKNYKLIWKSTSNQNINENWSIKDTGVNVPITQKPRLDPINGNSYLRAPDTFLAQSSGKYYGVSVFAENNGSKLWVQPIYITMDPYGSKFLNEWDGSMAIDEEGNYIMTSMIGAGKKDSENRYSGVVLGSLEKVKETTLETGILGFDKGIESFSLLNDGSATFGASGAGQIKMNGSYGYIMSANFNGFGGTPGNPPTVLNEKLDDSNFNFGGTMGQGVYIGMQSGNACFAGTLYSSKGNIGGWELDTGKLSSGTTYLYSKNQEDYSSIKLSDNNQFVSLNNWRIKIGDKFGVDSDGNLYAESITTLGAQFNEEINAAKADITNLKAKDVEITGKLSAAEANITNLQATDVTITGNLTALTTRVGTIEANYITTDKLDAVTADITDLKAKDVTISGNLSTLTTTVNTIKANYITADELSATTINGSQINATSYVTCQGLKVNGTSYTMNTEWVSYIEGESIPVVIGVDFDNKKEIWGSVWQIKTHTKKQLKFLGTKLQ